MEATAYRPFDALRGVAPAALAIIPVSLLFGVLAGRSDWSPLDVALIGLLGFTGSGQFAVLPLADSGAGFLTMLLLTASINSRYLPIAYVSAAPAQEPGTTRAAGPHARRRGLCQRARNGLLGSAGDDPRQPSPDLGDRRSGRRLDGSPDPFSLARRRPEPRVSSKRGVDVSLDQPVACSAATV